MFGARHRRWSIALLLAVLSSLANAAEPRSHPVAELQPLQAGVTLPVAVQRTLAAGKVKLGTVFWVATTQRVPVSQDAYLNRGVRVRGEVVTSDPGNGTAAHPSVLAIRFTQITYEGKMVLVQMRAIAAANLMNVADTFRPTNGGADRGNPSEANWNTRQVGGDEVYRAGWSGEVINSVTRTVGYADFYGVYSFPVKLDGGRVPRAMGVFSTSAEGLYGYDRGAEMNSLGGLITITNPEKRALIRGGDNLLLEVVPTR